MTDAPQSEELSPLQKAAYALKEMRARLDAAEGALREPIAIVGMGGRFPGADSCEALWELLINGVNAVGEIPQERWSLAQYYDPNPNAPGKMNARHGGFVQGVDQFDPGFFGIPAREAVKIDPQQRLLLEVAWEALENAGQAPDRLQGTQTGCYLGINQIDYGLAQFDSPGDMDIYTTTGNGFCFAAGRISYALGLHGPNMAVDTACSSSLVAVHLACQALRARECDLALAGGVQLNLEPIFHLLLAKTQSLSSSGRCNTFSSAADGLIMGEGCGVVVLKRLSDALANKDRVLATVRASAVNHGGAASGITVPNELAQEQLVRQVLERAAVDPDEVGYVETHGTGTQLGDPIEVGALSSVFRDRPQDEPLVLGSLKTNIGHLDAAAGIAGLIKAVLSLQHGQIPPNLHFDEPNPRIDWEACPLAVPVEPHPWPRGDKARHAGVSSFGFSGTNAHALLAEAPEIAGAEVGKRPLHLFALSAKDEAALGALVAAYDEYLQTADGDALADICFTATAGRAHFDQRLVIIAESLNDLRQRLAAWKEGGDGVLHRAVEGTGARRIALVFGDEFPAGAAAQFYATHAGYRQIVDRCAAVLEGPLLELFTDNLPPACPPALRASACLAHQYATAHMWRTWKIEPTLVAGHGVGEYAAACMAGVLGLEDALQHVAARAVLLDEGMERTPGAVETFAKRVADAARPPRAAVLSGSSGQWLSARTAPGADHWRQQFDTAPDDHWLQALNDKGYQHVLYLGGIPAADFATEASAHDLDRDDAWRATMTALAQLYGAGTTIDWEAFAGPYARQRLPLPTYAFQRQRYWFAPAEARNGRSAAAAAASATPPQTADETTPGVAPIASATTTTEQQPPSQRATAAENAVPASNGASGNPALNRIMAQQLQTASTAISQVVAQQLAYLRNNAGAGSAATTAAAAALAGKTQENEAATRTGTAANDPVAKSAMAEKNAPETKSVTARPPDWHHLLLLSADNQEALDAQTQQLAERIKQEPDQLAATAIALRAEPPNALRRMLISTDADDAAAALADLDPKRVTTATALNGVQRAGVFMFPGVGDHYAGMGRQLYESESVFRDCIDDCCARVTPQLGQDLLQLLYPPEQKAQEGDAPEGVDLRSMLKRGPVKVSDEPLAQTRLNQPAVFIVEYALAQLWMSWGIIPQALIGYSVGEYVAACLAGVMSLDDALALLVKRAGLIDQQPAGAMLAVPLPAEQIESLLEEHSQLSLAIVSTPNQCVVGGPPEAIAELEKNLVARKTLCRQLPTTHAFHSRMLEHLHQPIADAAQAIRLGEPQIPFLSNLTGTWIQAAEATSPGYWAEHTYKTVRFAEGMGELLKVPNRMLLEVGPGQNLSSFVFQHPAYKKTEGIVVLPTLRNSYDRQSDRAFLLNTLGKLWLSGADPDWTAILDHP